MDAIASVWLIKKFLPGWEKAELKFVPAGERITNHQSQITNHKSPIERIGEDEVIHVDTGMGSLDHHQTADMNVSAASLTWEFMKVQSSSIRQVFDSEDFDGELSRTVAQTRGAQDKVQSLESERQRFREEAIERIVKLVVDVDHFQEVFWDNPTADFHEFSLLGILEGLEFQKPGQDQYYVYKRMFRCAFA